MVVALGRFFDIVILHRFDQGSRVLFREYESALALGNLVVAMTIKYCLNNKSQKLMMVWLYFHLYTMIRVYKRQQKRSTAPTVQWTGNKHHAQIKSLVVSILKGSVSDHAQAKVMLTSKSIQIAAYQAKIIVGSNGPSSRTNWPQNQIVHQSIIRLRKLLTGTWWLCHIWRLGNQNSSTQL